MVRVIVWTKQADDDMEQIVDYWSSISENSVRLQTQRIFEKIDLIFMFPQNGRVVPEMGHPNIREHIVGHYRLVYYIASEQRIDILMVHNAARPLEMNDFN
ncbi:MAG: type II toxin-antitoxin system RelE/ParE family toxin [Saprospiraceae bacterium]|nr:type II toxin-antitoxin system RelE/ParE family toxin [Saprospiraceae bacterium]